MKQAYIIEIPYRTLLLVFFYICNIEPVIVPLVLRWITTLRSVKWMVINELTAAIGATPDVCFGCRGNVRASTHVKYRRAGISPVKLGRGNDVLVNSFHFQKHLLLVVIGILGQCINEYFPTGIKQKALPSETVHCAFNVYI